MIALKESVVRLQLRSLQQLICLKEEILLLLEVTHKAQKTPVVPIGISVCFPS